MKHQDTLRKQLTLANTCDLPIFIPCHDFQLPGDDDATYDCIQILVSHWEKCYSIYMYCFNRGLMQHQLWIRQFHNMHFGIRALILNSAHRHSKLIGIVHQMDVALLFSESDVPYFRDPDSWQFGTSQLVCIHSWTGKPSTPSASSCGFWRSVHGHPLLLYDIMIQPQPTCIYVLSMEDWKL